MCKIVKLWARAKADEKSKWLKGEPWSMSKEDAWCVGFFIGLEEAGLLTIEEGNELVKGH